MTDRHRDDPYEILGVARDATDQSIAAAHKGLARRFHPDIAGDGATVDMMRINAAFDAIRTPARRAAFATLASWEATPGRPGSSATRARPERSSPPGNGAQDGVRWRPPRDGTGGAGPPPGRPSGSVLDFGRHKGWSLGEIARVDPGYLIWLLDRREGVRYTDEIHALLDRAGLRSVKPGGDEAPTERRRRRFGRG